MGTGRFKQMSTIMDNMTYSYKYNLEYTYNLEPAHAHSFLEDLRRKETIYQEQKKKALEKARKADNMRLRNLIKDVRFSGNRTIVFWSDGTKTVAKCADADIYDKEKGLMAAICKKFYDDKCILPDMIERWCHNEVE